MLALNVSSTVASPQIAGASNDKVQTGNLTVFSGTQRDIKYTKALNNIEERTTKLRTGCTALCYDHTSRGCRNFLRVGLAAAGSCIGGLIAGFPGAIAVGGSSLAAIWIGSCVSGSANGCANFFAYETNSEDRDSDLELVVAQQAKQIEFLRIEIEKLKGLQTDISKGYEEKKLSINSKDIPSEYSSVLVSSPLSSTNT